ncbi:response regulator [Methanoregula sp.]|uniref:response regulator n=1 Tax=Methanoregula sp. TaxID=2052170 RepID=UPI002621B9D4|nr:response regulator [Methanoregula sp.]MDD5142412.1 response regulator [Methanoregula sp.]
MTKPAQRSGDNMRKEQGRPAPVVYTAEDVERIRKEYDAKFSELENRILKTIKNAVGPTKPTEGLPLRMAMPHSSLSWIEKASPRQLIDLLGLSLAEGQKRPDDESLFMAWGTLFSNLFLSSSDLQDDIDTISREDRELLSRVVHEDCARRGGKFVFSILQKGADLDRAALVVIANLNDLALVTQDGEPALTLLIRICDKNTRPLLIEKAGKRLLAGVCDRDGIPVLFSVFGLGDLSVYDIEAVERIFTKEELKKVFPKSGLGRSAFDAYNEVATRIRESLAFQRKSFMNARAGAAAETGNGKGGEDASASMNGDVQETGESQKPGDTSILILIVDDSRILRSLLIQNLKNLGYENIIEAGTGDEAVVVAAEKQPYLVFMDINMPGKRDGIAAAAEIRKTTDARVIFLTSCCNKETIDRAREIDPEGYILKPFSERNIRVALRLLN